MRKNIVWLWGAIAAASLAGALVWTGVAQPPGTGSEIAYARCVSDLNCSSCLLGAMNDFGCPSTYRCIAFKGQTSGEESFKKCTPSESADDWCDSDGGADYDPDILCSGFYGRCDCRQRDGQCPARPCKCDWMVADGPMRFIIYTECT